MDPLVDCPSCGHESDLVEFRNEAGHCPVCGQYNYELDAGQHYAAAQADAGGANSGAFSRDTPVDVTGATDTVSMSVPAGIGKMIWNGSAMTGQESAGFNPGPAKTGATTMHALRIAAAQFLDDQNTADREELLFRAHRHASTQTSQLPVPVAQRTVQAFVAAVHREILAGCDCGKDQGCEDCGAEAGEDCRPWCTGQAAHEDEKADKKKKSHRTAAVLPDFADELLFDS